ncbi:MAG: ATP-binding protein [Candidatus Omnitrophica bacterium]|nr:ATP-binding protein [Candidatus Omnitrophota bacterium]
MLIKKIQIEGYRSCKKTEFILNTNLSVLIGPNGSGKTNVLNAVLLLKKLLTQDEYRYSIVPEEQPTGQCKLKVWFEHGKKQIILNSVITIFTDEKNRDVIVNSREKWYLKDFTGDKKQYVVPLRFFLHEYERNIRGKEYDRNYRYMHPKMMRQRSMQYFQLNRKVSDIMIILAKFISEIKYYSASQFTNPARCPVSFEIEKARRYSWNLSEEKHSKFLSDLYREYKFSQNSRYAQYFEIIGPDGIGLVDDIDFKDIPVSSIQYSVISGGKVQKKTREKMLIIPNFKIGENNLSPNQLSEGTFKTITLLFYLMTENSSMLLVEEPEVCVHHGLLASIIELIKTCSYDKQIIVSTHSDFVLDKVEPESVYQVSRSSKNGTIVKHLSKSMSKKDLKVLKKYLETEGNLGEYWKHGALE